MCHLQGNQYWESASKTWFLRKSPVFKLHCNCTRKITWWKVDSAELESYSNTLSLATNPLWQRSSLKKGTGHNLNYCYSHSPTARYFHQQIILLILPGIIWNKIYQPWAHYPVNQGPFLWKGKTSLLLLPQERKKQAEILLDCWSQRQTGTESGLSCASWNLTSFCICIWHLQKVLADLHQCTLLCSRMLNAMNLWAKLNYRLC